MADTDRTKRMTDTLLAQLASAPRGQDIAVTDGWAREAWPTEHFAVSGHPYRTTDDRLRQWADANGVTVRYDGWARRYYMMKRSPTEPGPATG